MKQNIHPEYFTKVPVACSCGNTVEVNSTASSMKVEVCSACHPYYTGKQKMIDAAGRIDNFNKRLAKAEISHKKTIKKTAKSSRATKKPRKKSSSTLPKG